ncbi:MAG: crossover junction endodeoxyribonuclease RuvC [Sphaerochaetaceae bacterium]|nr:crossover junction endodeoxyribonuclease RuvC [Spirochaetales bacterium]MDY3768285.1 crossover junction endodeoxyribonuclease RuvC [Sphaerochaetaceae bacterium]MDY5967453.1 crossover junction endodeoxyribonuclease RuvC [Sphaerochaetaceae bacterium]
MRVLGIDPGLANTGWSIVESDGNRYSVIDYGVIKTSPSNDLTPRIAEIVSSILQIVQKYNPKGCGAEDIFFVKNISSGISVAKVIGALSYALNNTGIDVRLFTPTEIKKAIVGVGGADKEQIRKMVMLTTGMKDKIKSDHAADSVAGAITYCATFNMRNAIKG